MGGFIKNSWYYNNRWVWKYLIIQTNTQQCQSMTVSTENLVPDCLLTWRLTFTFHIYSTWLYWLHLFIQRFRDWSQSSKSFRGRVERADRVKIREVRGQTCLSSGVRLLLKAVGRVTSTDHWALLVLPFHLLSCRPLTERHRQR